ncbi:MAG: phosphoribosylanthranilate isomerase [Chitinispirillales bacterium]|jgi:phosphoribosylanthranilate isomerase|nr:phosphoribosylanthranilate isomerase [Chitinispirillales bacterium]
MRKKMRIKICGITRLEDARVAANLGIDALGFIFFGGSPRYISPMNAAEITKKVPPFISKVGVFVNESIERVLEVAQIAGLDTIQLHGDESPQYAASLPFPVIKAFQVRDDFDPAIFSAYGTAAGYLLDTWDPERRGGSGRTFDWQTAIAACEASDTVILSGGLGPSNIREAIESVRPYAVDVNSGVEISPGVKNLYKMKEVVAIVKENAV